MDLSSADIGPNCTRMGDNSSSSSALSILDLTGLDLDDPETWLYIPQPKDPNPDSNLPKLKSSKTIDTRTFTRPKKKYTRPSINDIEQMLSDGSEMTSSFEDNRFKVPETVQEEPSRPLQFDLTQPTSHNFDSFILGQDVDSFQNMSPPSLVNSLCSSTFANLMENSFIKNDPVLREIRDKDFTETALLQDIEAPMFQSITESCSSLNSDSPESFVKRVSKRNLSGGNDTITNEVNNATFEVQNLSVVDNTITESASNLNGTYRRSPKYSGTFRKSDLKNNRLSLNLALMDNLNTTTTTKALSRDLSKSIENDMNNSNKNLTILQSSAGDSMENLKRRFSSSEDSQDQLNKTYNNEEKIELNRTVDIKRSSLGSADSLDRMSSLSSSSKGSNKVLSMEDVEAIVEMQERSLSQVMSTPKAPVRTKKLWETNFISPIVAKKEALSDSELSEDYKQIKSNGSPTNKLGTYKKSQYPLQSIRASYSNISTLKSTTTLGGSQQNLYRPSLGGSQQNLYRPALTRAATQSSNLKTMGAKLKGSYTSLRPISATLPVVPPVGGSLNGTQTISRSRVNLLSRSRNVGTKIEPPNQSNGDSTFVKPQLKASGLPRPTGIPRPASRIPGPRSSNMK